MVMPIGHSQRSCSPGHLPRDHSLLAIWTSPGSYGEPRRPSGEAPSRVWVTSAAVAPQKTLVWEMLPSDTPAVPSASS